MSKFIKLINENTLRGKLESSKEEADRILEDNDKVQEFLDKVIVKVRGVPVLGQYLEEIPLLCNMVLDYIKRRYVKLPRTSIITITAALLYFLSPIDLIPDFIIGLGFVDDAFVIKIAIDGIRHDISNYKQWKESNVIKSNNSEDYEAKNNGTENDEAESNKTESSETISNEAESNKLEGGEIINNEAETNEKESNELKSESYM